MNVFILDKSMELSAQMLDDAHLKAQISEACQILMANWNHEHFPLAKIGHIHHLVTKFYRDYAAKSELICYLGSLLTEYFVRFDKHHQNEFWFLGFTYHVVYHKKRKNIFKFGKTYVNGRMTDDIDEIRRYIATKPHRRPLTWTRREKPDWWKEYEDVGS